MEKNHLFIWVGVNREQKTVRGELEAPTVATARKILHRQGIRVRKLSRRWFVFLHNSLIKSDNITVFARQLATLIDTGVSLVQALNIIIKSIAHRKLRNLVAEIRDEVQTGTKFHDAIAKYPQYFSNFFCQLVAVGEESGSLGQVLINIADHQEKRASIKRKIKKALFYPTAITVVALVVSAILLIFVVPRFEELFTSFNARLPAFTLLVIKLANILTNYIAVIITSIVILITLFILAKRHLESFNHFLDRLILRLPIVGKLIKKAILARFSAMLALSLNAGMPIIQALQVVAKSTGHYLYERNIQDMGKKVSTGEPLHKSMQAVNLFPPMITQMVAIGEESGQLEAMLTKIANIYSEEVDTTVAEFNNLLEPMIIVIVGLLVGSLVIAMYLPIFKLGSVI